MKKIKKVIFPRGNSYEGSPCIIQYTDGTSKQTIADDAYGEASRAKLTREEMKEIGL